MVLQTVFLALRARTESNTVRTNASLPADALSLMAIAAVMPLSYMHHFRSVRPSTLLALYFSALALLDIARLRTLWMVDAARSNGIFAVFAMIFILTVLTLTFESLPKYGRSNTAKQNRSELFSGFWARLTYAWLAETFRQGYFSVLSVENLPELDPQIKSHKLHDRLDRFWSKCTSW